MLYPLSVLSLANLITDQYYHWLTFSLITPCSHAEGEWFRSSPVPNRLLSVHRVRWYLELSPVCLHLSVPWLQVTHLSFFSLASLVNDNEPVGHLYILPWLLVTHLSVSPGLARPHCFQLCRRIHRSQISPSPAMEPWKPVSGTEHLSQARK